MMKNEEKFRQLIQGHIDNTLTDVQEEQLFAWIKDPAYQNLLEEFVDETILLPQSTGAGIRDERLQEISRFILSTGQSAKIRRLPAWTRVAVAASIMLILSLSAWLLYNNQTSNREKAKVVQANDVQAPATNRAMITLADGRTIYLDSTGNGTLASQSGVTVIKTADGQIVYDVTLSTDPAEVPYNTLHNPRGSKVIDLTLSDGSRVWLNAGSSVTYPVAFIGNERKVEMTGEGYFEVAKKAGKPFKVTMPEVGEVEVLGTQFNINSYSNEPYIKTTLLEGSIRIKSLRTNQLVLLAPGQQAQFNLNGEINLNNNPDLQSVIAWKEDKFIFQNADLYFIMRQLERWYDIEVSYEGDKYTDEFVGIISRNVNISEILNMLEKIGNVKFELNGRKLIVK